MKGKEDFIKGFAGVGLGFILFVPFQTLTSSAAPDGNLAEAPPTLKYPLMAALTIMFSAPIIYWGIKPAIRRLRRRTSSRA